MGHRNAFMVIPLWVIGNVSMHMSHRNAVMAVPLWVIRFGNANGCTTNDLEKYMNCEHEYDYVYEPVSYLKSDYVQDFVFVNMHVTRPKLLPGEFRVSQPPCLPGRFPFVTLRLLANCNAKPIGTGWGCDRVVSEHELYPMENARSDDAIGSSEALMSHMEQMLAALTESLRQQPMPPLSPPVETQLLEMEKLYEVFPCSETQKVGDLKLPTYVEVLDKELIAEATLAAIKQSKAPTTTKWRSKSQSSRYIPNYPKCGRKHKGICYQATGACFKCGKTNHIMRDCLVRSKNANHPTASSAGSAFVTRTNARTNAGGSTENETLEQGRVFTLVLRNVQNTESVVSKLPYRSCEKINYMQNCANVNSGLIV
ncbi:hypothetical protein CsSME_00001605 [Camellia sinensis var. sinensis]